MHCALIVVCDKALTFVVKCLASNIIADHAGIRNVSIIICCLKKDITDRIRPSLKSNKKNLCFIKKNSIQPLYYARGSEAHRVYLKAFDSKN